VRVRVRVRVCILVSVYVREYWPIWTKLHRHGGHGLGWYEVFLPFVELTYPS